MLSSTSINICKKILLIKIYLDCNDTSKDTIKKCKIKLYLKLFKDVKGLFGIKAAKITKDFF